MDRGVAMNFMKMKFANRIFEISAETRHSLLDCICAQRRLRSARAYTHSKQKLCRSSKGTLDGLANQRKAMTLISLCICAG